MSIKRYDYGYQDGYSADGMSGLQFSDSGALVKYEDHLAELSKIQSQLTALTSQLESVVAENAALKDDYRSTPALRNMGWPKTPATDAFLAEVRASGVEMFAASLKVVGPHEHPYSVVANEFAAQLRQGGAA